MPRLAAEISYNLLYKEYTHCDGGRGWKPSETTYRWEKRQMAKLSRRNAKVIIGEFEQVDYDLLDQLTFMMAYFEFVEMQQFAALMVEFMRPMCSGSGYCDICDGKE